MTWFLMYTPTEFVFPILYFVCLGVVAWGRKIKTGNPFNICVSAMYGMPALMVIPAMASGIIRAGYQSPQLPTNPKTQMSILLICFCVGGICELYQRCYWRKDITIYYKRAAMDTYHNLVAAPFLGAAVVTGAITLALQNSHWQSSVAGICLAFWVTMIAFDEREGRLNQAEYLKNHQITHV